MKSNNRFLLAVFVFILVYSLVISCDREPEKRIITDPIFLPPAFKVTRIIDGDTIELDNGEKVRLLGVDTPEKHESSKLKKDVERSGKDKKFIKALGAKASDFTKKLCEGKRVKLEYDQTTRDRYKRLLAYVYLPDGKLLNEEIILQGYGFAYLKYPFKQELMDRFRKAEKRAREEKRGLWNEGLEGF